jgi:hypothetical protein
MAGINYSINSAIIFHVMGVIFLCSYFSSYGPFE